MYLYGQMVPFSHLLEVALPPPGGFSLEVPELQLADVKRKVRKVQMWCSMMNVRRISEVWLDYPRTGCKSLEYDRMN